jgi:hypothetical protein
VGEEGKKRKGRDEPPYARYAFLNPYNLSLLAGAGGVAAATGHWWIAVCAAAAEGIWMLFAPDSKVLQKLWFDKIWEDSKNQEITERLNKKFSQLTPPDQARAHALRDQRGRILQLAAENPSLATELMKDELVKLDALLEDFLDLAVVCARCERQLAGFDVATLQRSWQMYEAQVQRYKDGDPRREVAQKNLEVLMQRKNRMDDLRRNLQTARGHMDLMENSFRLLGDEIVTMANPTELATRLDELRIGVQAIRETSAEAAELYEEIEQEPVRRQARG